MIRTYFNQKAATWDETASERDMTKLERMSQHLNIKPDSTVLDVGTGTGVFLPFLLKKIGRNGHIVALDIAEKMLEKAKAKGFNRNIDYLCAAVTNIPLDNEIFDSIVCYSTFPHFQDKPRALAEMKRVIKSGGKLLICHTSSRTTINKIHRQIPEVENDIIPNEGEMQIMLSKAGFTDIKIDDNSETYLCSARKPSLDHF
ncbi:MAG TPA: methyltransferase domain-containing protein [Dehalococcoidia bacterium]|nr:methyltransferase domain-containing protein [Dehalococcoidia bacterium]